MGCTGLDGIEIRLAADIARDLIELYNDQDTSLRIRRQLRIELQRLEPTIAAGVDRGGLPLLRRGKGYSLREIKSALAIIDLHAEVLAEP